MKSEHIVWIVAVAAACYGLGNPARKHENRVDSHELDNSYRRHTKEMRESGESAYRTNTNLVGIRILLGSINRAVWLCVALLLVLAGPQILDIFAL